MQTGGPGAGSAPHLRRHLGLWKRVSGTLGQFTGAKPSCNPSCSIGIEFTASREQGISNGPGARWRGNHDTAHPLLPERGRGLTPLPCGGDSEDGGDEEGGGRVWEEDGRAVMPKVKLPVRPVETVGQA